MALFLTVIMFPFFGKISKAQNMMPPGGSGHQTPRIHVGPCMAVSAGPDRGACYATIAPPGTMFPGLDILKAFKWRPAWF